MTRLHPGMRGRIDAVVPFVVLDLDEAARTWTWIAGRWPVRVELHHTVEATRGGGTRTTLTLRGAPWLVVPYLPLAQLALRRLVR